MAQQSAAKTKTQPRLDPSPPADTKPLTPTITHPTPSSSPTTSLLRRSPMPGPSSPSPRSLTLSRSRKLWLPLPPRLDLRLRHASRRAAALHRQEWGREGREYGFGQENGLGQENLKEKKKENEYRGRRTNEEEEKNNKMTKKAPNI